jgi:hypothetical protein
MGAEPIGQCSSNWGVMKSIQQVKSSSSKNEILGWVFSLVVEGMPSIREVLSLVLSTAKINQKG